MSLNDTERRRQAWLAFASAAVSGYTPLEETYKSADALVDETTANCAVLADEMLIEYLKREREKFGFSDEIEEEIEDPDEDPEEEEEEEEIEEEEEEEDDEPEEKPKRRAPAKKRSRR